MNIFKYSHTQEKTDRFLEETDSVEMEGEVSIVGEIGINHNSDIETAKKLIDVASHCGCTHVKFQKRVPSECVPEEKKDEMRQTPWGNMKYIEYKNKIEFGKDEYQEIDWYCKKKNIDWFASVWDLPSVDFMSNFVNIGKIPSAHLTNTPVLKEVRKRFDTMIVSTGMSTQDQINHAVNVSNPDVIMHSVSSYPTEIKEINLEYVRYLRRNYPNIKTGYSGHERGVISSSAAVALGATWIERHITLDNRMWGSDQNISLEPSELKSLVENVRTVEKAMGSYGKREMMESEKSKKKSLRKNE